MLLLLRSTAFPWVEFSGDLWGYVGKLQGTEVLKLEPACLLPGFSFSLDVQGGYVRHPGLDEHPGENLFKCFQFFLKH